MFERHRELGLADEALAQAFVDRQLGCHQLECDRSPEPQVVGSIHDAHAALTDPLLDPVTEELGADLDLGRGGRQRLCYAPGIQRRKLLRSLATSS